MGYSYQGHSSHRAFISYGIHLKGLSSQGGLILERFVPRGFVLGDCPQDGARPFKIAPIGDLYI